jgi:mono/diheme cytochrome c family protein
MTKKPFIVFGLVLVLMVVAIPLWAFLKAGDPDHRTANGESGRMEVPQDLKKGQSLFETNCGTCHTLYAAGTDGDFGPNLDQQLAPAGTATGPGAASTVAGIKTRVLNAIDNGYDDDTYPGRMPPGIVVGPEADSIAEFVAQTAGRG